MLHRIQYSILCLGVLTLVLPAFIGAGCKQTVAEPAALFDLSAKDGKHSARWFIRKRYDPAFSLEPSFDADRRSKPGTEPWKPIEKFPIIPEKLYPRVRGYGEFTVLARFDAPDQLLKEGVHPGILFPRIGQVFRIHLNGKFAGGDGITDAQGLVLNRDRRGYILPVDRAWLRPRNNLLVIRLAGETRSSLTGLSIRKGYYIGPMEKLREVSADGMDMILAGVYFFVGLYHILLFLKRPGEKYNLHFAFVCTGIAFYMITRTDMIFKLPVDSTWIHRVELIVLFSMAPHFSLFLHELYNKRARALVLFVTIASTGMAVMIPLVPEYIHVRILKIWQVGLLLPLMFPLFLYLAVRGVMDQFRDARRLIVGVLLLLLAGIADVLDSLYFRTGISFGKYAFFAMLLGIALILANRFLRVHKEVEDLNRTLEEKVDERTQQLNDSLNDVRRLKEQQDGDYYLTSLLVEPLGVNHARSERATVEMFVAQKKQFNFRKWQAQIGGDICAAYNLKLMDRDYLVVLNGDAMGKSIQGAAGALVLGTVFKSIVTRTHVSQGAAERHPERWLSDCFHEIRDVYSTFEGFMLVAAMVGLLDEQDGMFYFVNAELPPPVLYRGGKATFLGDGASPWKIGIKSEDRPLRVFVEALSQDDILISGSDGRDDLQVGIDANGNRVINEDEKQFLNVVEKSDGRLDLVIEELSRRGEPTDDISLLRLGYMEDRPLPTNIAGTRDPEPDAKNADPAVHLAYIQRHPANTNALHQYSLLLNRLERWREAADYGEKCRLRDPNNTDYLLNLAEIYPRLGATERARNFVARVLRKNGDSPRALQLQKELGGEEPKMEGE